MLPGATIKGIVRSGLTVRMGGPNEGERLPVRSLLMNCWARLICACALQIS